MPAQSKQQQKFMGLVHAIQKGDVPASDASTDALKVAQDMNPSDVKDFASTSHKGLPKKVKQEIVKKLKEYAMTLPNHHAKPAAPMEPLRSDDEMDLQKETRIPQNFNVGTTRDYHTKLATTPRKKYDKTNFNTAHSGQEDLEEAQAVSGGKVHKFITGKNLGFKGKKYSEIEFETLGVDNKNGTIRLKILAPKEIFGNEMSLDFRSVRRGPYFKTDTSKVNEASPCWDGYKQIGMKNKGGRQVPNCVKESVNELKLNDLVGNQYKYVIGSGEEKYLGKNDKKYVLEMIAKSLKTYLYDDDFALNYLDGSQRREYNTFFEKEVLASMLKKVDFTLNNFFTLDKDKVKWKLSSSDTRKMVDEIFRKNSKIPSDIKKEYYAYRLEYAGVKLKESVKESTKRDYKAEYKKFQSSTESKKYRAELNKYNRDKGTYGNGDGKDASHVNGKIVGFEDESVNRGRAEKSRLKKESVNETKVHFKKELKNGNIFQVVDRDTTGMRGTQDKFKMQIVDKSGKVVKDLGSHPSLSGAEKFGKKFEEVNEYGQALDLHFILNKDAKLDGTPEPKKAIGEELSFDEKEMVIGIIEILKQVEDPKNRMRIALNMLKKFKEEGIEFDYQKFMDHLKEYSMGSYEYDKSNRELGESIIKSMKDVVIKLLPTNTLARHASDANKNKEFVSKIVRELGSLLNRFYKQNDIDVVLK
jgi:hypothetical protein